MSYPPQGLEGIPEDIGDASASTLGSLYAILGNPAQTVLAMLGYEGATALANKLTAARAALLDQITAGRMSELDAANLPADIDTLLTRLSAVRAGYLDELAAANIPADVDTLLTRVTAAVALASVCTEARLAELDPANIPADINTLLTRITAAVALASVCTEARLSELDAANIPTDLATITAYVDELETRLSAVRAGYLDNLSAGAVALASVCTAARLGELDAANIPADIDTLLARVTAAVALASSLTTHDTDIKALLAAAALEATLTAIKGAGFATGTDSLKILSDVLDAITTHLTDIKGGTWSDETLVAIKAAIDAIPTTAERGTDNALLAASYTAPDNAGIATLLTRITAAVALASALTTHDTDIKALLATIAGYIDNEVGAIETKLDTPANFMANVTALALEATLTAIKGADFATGTDSLKILSDVLDAIKAKTDNLKDSWNDITAAAVKTAIEAAGSHLALIKAQTDKIADKMLFTMDFWSVPQISVVVPAGAANQALPDVVVAGLPGTMTVVKATAMFKFRMLDNAGAANKLDGAQHIQIQKGGAGGYADAISLIDDQFGIAEATREGGDVVVGDHNVVAKVDADATYNFQWTAALADVAGLTFCDVQMGIRIWYKV